MPHAFAIITSNPTAEQRMKWAEPAPKPRGRTDATWTQDHLDTRKAMWWCSTCEPWVKPAAQGYRLKPNPTNRREPIVVRGMCDRCGDFFGQMRLWIHRDSPDANL